MASQVKTINTINTAVTTYVASYKAGRVAIAAMLKAIKGSDLPFERKALAQPLMESVAQAYGIKLVSKERGTGGTWDLDNADVKVAREHNAAKQCHKEMLAKLFEGGKSQAPEAVALTRKQLTAIKVCMELGITMKLFGRGVAQLTK